MQCPRCLIIIPHESKFCLNCGKKLIRAQNTKKRGNGTGSVYQLPNGKWRAVKTLGYWVDTEGKKHRATKSENFDKKKDAIAFLESLQSNKQVYKDITLKDLYDKWKPTHNRGKDTMNCYNAAMNYFRDLWFESVWDIDVDDLQECIDNCPKGKRTRENMKTVIGLIYKYGIPRNYIPSHLNLAEYLIVRGEKAAPKVSFTNKQIELIRQNIGKVEYADYIYAHIYLGFRPSEFLRLDVKDYNRKEKALTGGSKTEAGMNRTVTISPKIQHIIDRLIENKISGPIFCDEHGNKMRIELYRSRFYTALEEIGIKNPITIIDGKEYRTYTPHTCRHTFATLMKNIKASDKDKLALIGHASEEMLRYYQDVSYEDLRRITDAI